MGDELDGDGKMTQFYYGATVENAKIMAVRGAILSPLLMERAWLQYMKYEEPDYYEELVKGKTLDSVARELALTEVPEDQIDKIILTHSVTHSLLRLAKSQEQKIVLGLSVDHPPALFLPLPGPVYLENQLTGVHLYEDAVERKKEITDAFKQYTKNFYIVRKK